MKLDKAPGLNRRGWWLPGMSLLAGALALLALGWLCRGAAPQEYDSGVWPKVPVVDPGPPGGAPSDAIILFDGKNLSHFNGADKWLVKDGYAEIRGGNLVTKQSFGDCQLHLEWASPVIVSGKGQWRGNSGVFLMGRYEVQILDSFDNETYPDGQAGSIYKQHPPLVNVCRKPGQWQTYDIIFEAPRFDAAGKLQRPAYVTVLHNGVLVQNHFELTGSTSWSQAPKYTAHPAKLPLLLQNHSSPVRFRNIWLRELATRHDGNKSQPAQADGRAAEDPNVVDIERRIARIKDKYGVVVQWKYNDSFLPAPWRSKSKGSQIKIDEAKRLLGQIEKFLAVVPPAVSRKHLRNIYMLHNLEVMGHTVCMAHGQDLFMCGHLDAYLLWPRLFHEFAHVLHQRVRLDRAAWDTLLPKGFHYEGDKALGGNPFSTSEIMKRQGFLMQYSKASLEEEVALLSDYAFTKQEELNGLIAQYPKIREKVRQLVKYYKSIDQDYDLSAFNDALREHGPEKSSANAGQ